MTLEEFIKLVNKKGFSVNLTVESNGVTSLSICRDSWVTNNLYAAHHLPTAIGKSIQEAVDSMVALVYDRRPE